jgi:hypothetical protein
MFHEIKLALPARRSIGSTFLKHVPAAKEECTILYTENKHSIHHFTAMVGYIHMKLQRRPKRMEVRHFIGGEFAFAPGVQSKAGYRTSAQTVDGASNAPGELDVLDHNGDPLRMYCAQVAAVVIAISGYSTAPVNVHMPKRRSSHNMTTCLYCKDRREALRPHA